MTPDASALSPGGVRPVRRVVVALQDGSPRVVADGPSPHVHTLPGMPPDLGLTDCWYTDGAPSDRRVADPADRDLVVAPGPGGTLFRVVQFPPDAELPTDDEGRPTIFWHETPTVDYNVVLDGDLVFVTDRDEVALHTGDVIVVRGGRHAWSNRTAAPAQLATVGVGLVD